MDFAFNRNIKLADMIDAYTKELNYAKNKQIGEMILSFLMHVHRNSCNEPKAITNAYLVKKDIKSFLEKYPIYISWAEQNLGIKEKHK